MLVRRPCHRHPLAALSLAVTVGVLGLYFAIGHVPLIRNMEAQMLNLRFQLRGPVEPGPEVVILAVDDKAIAELGRWPLSRNYFAAAIDMLRADGARVIALDLLFTEPEGWLPEQALERIHAALEADSVRARLDRVLEQNNPDRHLATAIRTAGNVLIPFAFVFDRREANVAGLPRVLERASFKVYRIPAAGEPNLMLRPEGVLLPVPELAEAADHIVHVTVAFDTDGSLRYEYPVIAYHGEFFPSLPIEAVRGYLGVEPTEVIVDFGDGIRIGDHVVPTDAAMRLLVNYYGPSGQFPTYSFADLVQGRLAPGLFRDRIVLIGGTAVGIRDISPSPFTQTLSGVERYATIIDNILHRAFLVRRDWTVALEGVAIVICGLLVAMLTTRLPLVGAGLVAAALLAGWSTVNYLAFARGGLWLNYMFPAAAIVLNFGALALFRVVREERQRRLAERHRANLARYFSPNVLDALLDRDEPFAFDRTQRAAVLFVDIVGFTRICERLSPAEAIDLLRRFHHRVEDAVFAHQGTLDKFLGDGAMATFGIPVPTPYDAVDALACARALAIDIAAWRSELIAAGQPPIAIGIGVHYGPVLMGDLGGERRFEFTVIGDTVNVASRLEGLTRQLEVTIVASDAVVAAAGAAGGKEAGVLDGFTAVPDQQLRGRDGMLAVWAWRE